MSQLVEQDDEIDLSNVFATIWYNGFVVLFFAAVFTALAAIYAFNFATPQYKASSRFELLEKENKSDFGQASGLAALAGVTWGGGTSEADTLIDRILSRPFADSIYEEAAFISDPVFNGFIAEPGLVTRTLSLVFGPPPEGDPPTRIDLLESAIGSLALRMEVEFSENGFIKLTLHHPDPHRAAYITNVIVKQSLEDIFQRERTSSRNRLNYFAEELLSVRADWDAANVALRDFALENNVQSAEELARTSIQLAQLRGELAVLEQSSEALNFLSDLEAHDFSGDSFSLAFPVSTSLSFRRLIGVSANPSQWKLPSDERLAAAFSGLDNQRASLNSSIAALLARARVSGEEALNLASLEREAQVQQAIYESAITQFETQSLFSGFEQASGRVLEEAIPSGSPFKPRRVFLSIVGLAIGIVAGTTCALALAARMGSIHGVSAIARAFNLGDAIVASKRKVIRYSERPHSIQQSIILKDTLSSLAEDCRRTIIVSPTNSNITQGFANNLAKAYGEFETKIGILQCGTVTEIGAEKKISSNTELYTVSTIGNAEILVARDPSSFLKKPNAQKVLDDLETKFSKVLVVCPPPKEGIAISRVFAGLADSSIILASRSNTQRRGVDAVNRIFKNSNVANPILVIV